MLLRAPLHGLVISVGLSTVMACASRPAKPEPISEPRAVTDPGTQRLLASAAFQQWELDPNGFRSRAFDLGAAHFDVLLGSDRFAMSDEVIERWLRAGISGVADYYGTFPAPRVLVVVIGAKQGIFGTVRGGDGASVLLRLGPDYDEASAARGWVLTHELLHLVFPEVAGDSAVYAWVGEGLSTYLEPIVRVRAGSLTVEELWRDLLRDAAQGLPVAGDEGLDRTATWGRTYWGGALFWLEADVTLRERTSDGRSLEDALRAIAARGGNVTSTWNVDSIFEAGDMATGTTVLTELHRLRGQNSSALDLDELWRRLGVGLEGEHVVFDDSAPLAALRRNMTSARD